MHALSTKQFIALLLMLLFGATQYLVVDTAKSTKNLAMPALYLAMFLPARCYQRSKLNPSPLTLPRIISPLTHRRDLRPCKNKAYSTTLTSQITMFNYIAR